MPEIENSAEGQVRALLENRAYAYATEVLGDAKPFSVALHSCFSVRRPEIDAVIARSAIDVADYGSHHGLKLFRRNGVWIVSVFHWAERSPEYEEEIPCESEGAAREMLLDRILRNSQTGIDFSGRTPLPGSASARWKYRRSYWARQASAVALFSLGIAMFAWSVTMSRPFGRQVLFGSLLLAFTTLGGAMTWQDVNWSPGRSKGLRILLTSIAVAALSATLFVVYCKHLRR